MNREIRKKIKAAKVEWIEEQRENIEKGMMSGNSKEAYSTLKALTKTQDSSGNILLESTAVPKQ